MAISLNLCSQDRVRNIKVERVLLNENTRNLMDTNDIEKKYIIIKNNSLE